MTLRLFGACARYLAYVYYALVRASHTGLSRRRGFRIERVRVDGRNVAADEESFSVPETSLSLCFPASTRVRAPYRVHLTTHSPLRVKARGEFLNSLDWKELWIAATRRVSRVADRFCDTGARIDWIEALREVPTVLEEDGAFDWIDARYRSRPQERVLKLGGIVGTLDARVLMSPLEREVAKSLEILHLGKNTTFGLGEVAVAISATGEAHEQ